MKPFVMLVLFICLCSLYALTAPTNVRAAAIGHDAFTLRWDAVAGATGYEVYVNQGMEQFTMHNFDAENTFPEGWTYERVSFISNYPNLSYSRNNFLSMDAAPGLYSKLVTPILHNPQTFSFRARLSGTNSGLSITLFVDYSSDGVDWTSLASLSQGSGENNLTTSYKLFSFSPQLIGEYYLRISKLVNSSNNCSVFIDDFAVTEFEMDSITGYSPQPNSYHATRVSGISPNTDYLYRVRAIADLQAGPFSEWQSITTLAEAPANAANGSAINSIPVTITLPQIGTYPQQSIEIAPNIGDGDFLVAVDEPAANTISYSITAADGELPGSYIIHHPGFTASNLEVLSAQYDAVTLANGSSSLSITSFTGKGTLQILLNLDETLPVQMGRMMLVPVGVNGVNLQWFSYSESELAGYYVLRSESNDLNQAQYVSSMIEATNTSSTVHYMFQDADASENCYYWLEARDYSGASEFFGPEYYEKLSPGNDLPPILQNTLHAIYPNPFNPSTTISYSLAEPNAVSIKIYDARGRLIYRHNEATKSAGRYQYIWNAEGAASGVYFVKLEIGERSFERKLVLLK